MSIVLNGITLYPMPSLRHSLREICIANPNQYSIHHMTDLGVGRAYMLYALITGVPIGHRYG